MTIQSQQGAKADIGLAEILASPVLRNGGIRFICAMRKILGEAENLSEDEIDIAYDVNRFYCKLTAAERYKAHEAHPHANNGFRNPQRHGLASAANTMLPKPTLMPNLH